MTTLKFYVQTKANDDPSIGEEVVLSSGMAIKKFTPRPKRVFHVENTKESGTVKIWCPRTKKDIMFDFEYTRTPDDIASYVATGPKPAATRFIKKLIKSKEYFFRWSSITSKGRSDWSDFISMVIT